MIDEMIRWLKGQSGMDLSWLPIDVKLRLAKRRKDEDAAAGNPILPIHVIKADQINVIDKHGVKIGLMSTHIAQQMANEQGLELIHVEGNRAYPIYRIG